jgi:hypothetical protein
MVEGKRIFVHTTFSESLMSQDPQQVPVTREDAAAFLRALRAEGHAYVVADSLSDPMVIVGAAARDIQPGTIAENRRLQFEGNEPAQDLIDFVLEASAEIRRRNRR